MNNKPIKSLKFPLCFLLIFILSIFPLNFHASSVFWSFDDISSCSEQYLLTDNYENIYLLGITGTKVEVKQITNHNNCNTASFSIKDNCERYTAMNGKIYFPIQYSIANSYGKTSYVDIAVYDTAHGELSEYTINNLELKTGDGFAVSSSGNFFCVDDKKRNAISCYSQSGNLLYTRTVEQSIIQIKESADGNTIYIFTSSQIYMLNCPTQEVLFLSNHSLTPPIGVTKDGYIADRYGNITNTNNSSIKIKSGISSNAPSNTAFADEFFCQSYENKIYGYNINTAKESILHIASGNIDLMTSTNSHIITFSNNTSTLNLIDKNELRYPSDPVISNNNTNSSKGNNSSSQPKNNNLPNLNVSSSVYEIDYDNKLIFISQNSTIAQLKANISYGDLSPNFFDYNNNVKTSGNIGTGASVRFFYNGLEESAYTFILLGDLTGEGNVNTRDKSLMKNYLLGKTSFEYYTSVAADCNNDETIDTIDLLKIAKNNI